ncbi:hypothetical protein Tco_0492333 [Tanacetum coccineum]
MLVYQAFDSCRYTSVSIPVEDNSDMGSPGVDGPSSLDYVPGPKEPEQAPPSPVYLPYSLLPLPFSTTADSPGYIPESDLERDPEEDDEEDPEEDPADYPADRRDDDDDDDDDDEEEDKEEEEEHLAPADYTVVALPTVDHVPSKEETKPFETDELPISHHTIPSHHPIAPTISKVPESCLPLRKRLRFAAPTPNHEVGESSAAGAARQDGPAVAREDPYSDDLVGAIEEIAPTTLEGVNQRVTNLSTTVEQETTIMYGMMEDAQDDRSLLRARVKLLYRDRPVHRRLAVMIEREAVGQRALISELQSADHRRQGVIKELLAADHQRQVQLTKALKLTRNRLPLTQMAKVSEHWTHKRTTTPEDAMQCHGDNEKWMTDKYCPRGEIKKLEFEMWNLKVKGTDVVLI